MYKLNKPHICQQLVAQSAGDQTFHETEIIRSNLPPIFPPIVWTYIKKKNPHIFTTNTIGSNKYSKYT
jgi:hypothetical protein